MSPPACASAPPVSTTDRTPSDSQPCFGNSLPLALRQPQVVFPSQRSRQPSARSASVSVLGTRPVAARGSSRIRMFAVDGGKGCVDNDRANISDGSYPISRPLFIYVNTDKAANPAVGIRRLLPHAGCGGRGPPDRALRRASGRPVPGDDRRLEGPLTTSSSPRPGPSLGTRSLPLRRDLQVALGGPAPETRPHERTHQP